MAPKTTKKATTKKAPAAKAKLKVVTTPAAPTDEQGPIGPQLPATADNVIVVSDLSSPTTLSHSTDRKHADDTKVSIMVKPGSNFFEKEEAKTWAVIKEGSRTAKEMLDEGVLRELVVDGEHATPDSLKDFDQKMAIDVVRGTADGEVLKTWLDEEERTGVTKALQAQIKLIKQVDEQREKAQKKAA